MTRDNVKLKKLDRTLLAIEQLILSSPDDQIIADAKELGVGVNDIKNLVGKYIQKKSAAPSQTYAKADIAKSKMKKPAKQNWLAKLAFLQEMAKVNPDIAPRLGAVLSSGKRPKKDEIEKLIEDLIQLGLLSKDHSDLD